MSDEIPLELTLQMGRYVLYTISLRDPLVDVNGVGPYRKPRGKYAVLSNGPNICSQLQSHLLQMSVFRAQTNQATVVTSVVHL
jgi:hypothetical protein